MDNTTVFNAIVLGILAGVAAFSLTVALAVWRKRNRGESEDRQHSLWKRYGWIAAAGGAACMLFTAIHRELPDRHGLLRAKDIFTVRAHDEMELDYLAEANEVSAGELLARFSSPKQAARVEELQLSIQMLEAQHRALTGKALELDSELVRRDQQLLTDVHQYRVSKEQLLPARDQLSRERLQQKLDAEKEVRNLDRELAWLSREEAKMEAHYKHLDAACERFKKAAARSAATAGEVEEKQLELSVARESLEQVRQRKTDLQVEKERRVKELTILTDMVATQAASLKKELDIVIEGARQSALEQDNLEACLAADQERARKLRQQDLIRLELQADQCRAELKALDQVQNIRSPFAGRVVFRESSPKTAYQEAPLIVLAPAEGLLLQCRLPAGEIKALAKSEQVTFELGVPSIQKRFTGYYVGHEALVSEPRYVAALLAVQPPKDCIRDLVIEADVLATLRWRPSLLTYPVFLGGLATVIIWIAGSLILSVRPTRNVPHAGKNQLTEAAGWWGAFDVKTKPPGVSAAVNQVPFQGDLGQGSKVETSLGASGVVLHRLASMFREAVFAETLDSSLISAVEWAFDRHHVRAINMFRDELTLDPDFAQALLKLINEEGNPDKPERISDCEPPRHISLRLMRICRTVFPRWAGGIDEIETRYRSDSAVNSTDQSSGNA